MTTVTNIKNEDSTPINTDTDTDTKKDETNTSNTIDFKSYGIFAILFLIVTSDVFQENILSNFESAMDGRNVTTTGMLITVLMLLFAHMLIMHNI